MLNTHHLSTHETTRIVRTSFSFSNETATIERSLTAAVKFFSLTGALIVILGAVAFFTFYITAITSWKSKKFISDADPVTFLQFELEIAKRRNDDLERELKRTRDQLTNAQNDIVKANDAVASNLTSLQQMIKQKDALHLQSEGQEQAYKSLQEAYECNIFGMVDVINERTQEILALDTATYKLG